VVEIGRALGLRVPELVFVEVGSELGRNEPDQEIRDLLKGSVGLNLGMDFLPGATMFDPAAGDVAEAGLASMVVWFDALIANVDRTARNPNLLIWHKELRPIDHGAALLWQHDWERRERTVGAGFGAATRQHVLLPWASEMEAVTEVARRKLAEGVFEGILEMVPRAWLMPVGRVEAEAGETVAMRRWQRGTRRGADCASDAEGAISLDGVAAEHSGAGVGGAYGHQCSAGDSDGGVDEADVAWDHKPNSYKELSRASAIAAASWAGRRSWMRRMWAPARMAAVLAAMVGCRRSVGAGGVGRWRVWATVWARKPLREVPARRGQLRVWNWSRWARSG